MLKPCLLPNSSGSQQSAVAKLTKQQIVKIKATQSKAKERIFEFACNKR